MRRRAFLALFAVPTSWSLAGRAEQTKRIARIGYLAYDASGASDERQRAFLDGLHDLGYVEGKTLQIESRNAGDRLDRLAELTKELIEENVAVLVASGLGVSPPPA